MPDSSQLLEELGMRIEVVPVSKLKPYLNNPNEHDEESYSAISASISEYGFAAPIVVDKDYEIIAGHGRLEGAIRNGLEKVIVIVASDLDKVKSRALRIADNLTQKKSDFDLGRLIEELDSLAEHGYNIEHTGFDDLDLEKLRSQLTSSEEDESADPYEDQSPQQDLVAKFVIVFRNEAEKSAWYGFLKRVSAIYPDLELPSERVLAYIRSNPLNDGDILGPNRT